MVEVQPGKGTSVKDLTGDLFVPLPVWVSDYRDTIHKHFEARLILEPEAEALKNYRVQHLGVSHCTGLLPTARLAREFGERLFFNAAGTLREFIV